MYWLYAGTCKLWYCYMAYNLRFFTKPTLIDMKYIYSILVFVFFFGSQMQAQNYVFRYNPYSGMNQEQLELALKQSEKLENNGKIWTAVGAGMMFAGGVMTFNGIQDLSLDESNNYGTFAAGLGILCASAFPLGYGLIAWITGSERSNMIEIELLATDREALSFRSTEHGVGLVFEF